MLELTVKHFDVPKGALNKANGLRRDLLFTDEPWVYPTFTGNDFKVNFVESTHYGSPIGYYHNADCIAYIMCAKDFKLHAMTVLHAKALEFYGRLLNKSCSTYLLLSIFGYDS